MAHNACSALSGKMMQLGERIEVCPFSAALLSRQDFTLQDEEPTECLAILDCLSAMPISVRLLEATRAGRTLSGMVTARRQLTSYSLPCSLAPRTLPHSLLPP